MTKPTLTGVANKVVAAKPRKAIRLFQHMLNLAGTVAQPTSCRLGCAACCHTVPMVRTAMEEKSIEAAILENTNGARTHLSRRIDYIRYCDERAKSLTHVTSGPMSFVDEWRALPSMPSQCPAQHQTICAIYEARPIECAVRFSYIECSLFGELRDRFVPQMSRVTEELPPDHTYSMEYVSVVETQKAIAQVEALCLQIDHLRGLKGTPQFLSSVLLKYLLPK